MYSYRRLLDATQKEPADLQKLRPFTLITHLTDY